MGIDWDKIQAHKEQYHKKQREKFLKIKWKDGKIEKEKITFLINLWELKKEETRVISKADYEYIKNCNHQQNVKQNPLSKEQLKICNRIFKRYDDQTLKR